MVEVAKNNFVEQVSSVFSTNFLNKKEDIQADRLNDRGLLDESNETTIKVSTVGVALVLVLGVALGVCLAVTMAPPLVPALAGAEAVAASVASAAEVLVTIAPAVQFLSSNLGLIGSLSTVPAAAGVFFAALSRITSKLPEGQAQQFPSNNAEEVPGEVASIALPKEPADKTETEVPAVPAHGKEATEEAADEAEADVGVLATPTREEAAKGADASAVAALNKSAQSSIAGALLGSEELASSVEQSDQLPKIPEKQRRRISGILKHLAPVTPAAADKRVKEVVLEASPIDWMM